ncbi:putative Monocarboxylate transporter 14 [Hypsibius exemplaris]|uniref:Monocarboxylate transporter 14 n=1 Tax=Hypsibius exemplaris TaxID=2072580 RepID=A0A9X6RNP2_HYPEX|nr:putative Monocarboxylate transporter 14 [Hypsibius exemplaris]
MTPSKPPIIIINENYDDDEGLPHPYTSRPMSGVPLKSSQDDEYDTGKAWLVLVAAFFGQMLIFGVELTFGLYSVAYQEAFHQSESVISWVGAISYGVMFIIGPLASILISRMGVQIAMTVAGGLAVLGYITSYFAQDHFHLYISFGVLVGAGMGIGFLSCYAILPDYFRKYLRMASIIVSIGGGVGIFFFNAVFQHLIEEYGWRGSMLINAGICMHIFLFALIMKSRRRDPSVRKPTIAEIMGVHVLANVKFRIFLLHVFLWNVGFIIVFTLLNSFVIARSGLTTEEAALIGMFVGILNTVGRITSVPLERFVSPVKVYVVTTLLMGVCQMGIAAGMSQIGYGVPASAAGFFFGVMICYLVPVIGEFVGFDNLSPALGYSNFMQGVGALVGTPLLAMLDGGTKFVLGGGITTASGVVIGYAAWRHLRDAHRTAVLGIDSGTGLNKLGADDIGGGYVLPSSTIDAPSVKYSKNLGEMT